MAAWLYAPIFSVARYTVVVVMFLATSNPQYFLEPWGAPLTAHEGVWSAPRCAPATAKPVSVADDGCHVADSADATSSAVNGTCAIALPPDLFFRLINHLQLLHTLLITHSPLTVSTVATSSH
jgi:hypothetical protein